MRRRSILLLAVILLASSAFGEDGNVPSAITTPEQIRTRLGMLSFPKGIPTAETASKVYDQLDYIHGVETFLNSFGGVSMYAIRKGFRDAGVPDDSMLIFSGLMDSKSLFLTANCDTIYFWGYLDLSHGPMVVEVPPESLGIFDDMWFRWIGDFGAPGPDRGLGGKYLLLPPGYQGPVPDGGFYVYRSRTYGVGAIARAFLQNDDPKPAVERIKTHMKIYHYAPGGEGTSIADFLGGRARLGRLGEPVPATFVEGTGKVMNTIPPNDASFFELLDRLVQEEPASALDPEVAGQFAALGIVKGRKFQPDPRMQNILEEAAAMGNATARTIGTRARPSEGFQYYGETSAWMNPLFKGGYQFQNPPPLITKEGVKPFPNTGARALDARTSFFYLATVITPAMCMNLTNIGSQYLGSFYDEAGKPFEGAKTYKIVLPKGIPAAKFWSLTLYDNETRSMLATPQRFPRAGSQAFPTPAARASDDGSVTVIFSPKQPNGVPAGNWIQTMPGKGWFVLFRLYSPLESFFDKTWRPSEIQEVR
jgi:hypothetical protein